MEKILILCVCFVMIMTRQHHVLAQQWRCQESDTDCRLLQDVHKVRLDEQQEDFVATHKDVADQELIFLAKIR
jgi:hypothetical protein